MFVWVKHTDHFSVASPPGEEKVQLSCQQFWHCNVILSHTKDFSPRCWSLTTQQIKLVHFQHFYVMTPSFNIITTSKSFSSTSLNQSFDVFFLWLQQHTVVVRSQSSLIIFELFFFLHSYSPQFSGSLRFHSPNLGTVDNDKLHQEKVNIDFIFIPYRLALGPLNYLVFVRRPDGGAHSIFHSGWSRATQGEIGM